MVPGHYIHQGDHPQHYQGPNQMGFSAQHTRAELLDPDGPPISYGTYDSRGYDIDCSGVDHQHG
ncbi:hypothetical protein PGT21_022608 [Puccinia graminis f. sp. tritici]|uniref:Uncharacterized protein n=1 Tax=Puccinia graminis f. sp. tritici TaxID=56615 RepID=A0A5B0LRE7_PUCGR|nr:hypothetical protein PGTUg99_014579 [Puccinia graminis f. sp. tritici]KAA1071912.1 hypothetical protein PGT21_022608 [Puccinia graminis f. sp. tritici]